MSKIIIQRKKYIKIFLFDRGKYHIKSLFHRKKISYQKLLSDHLP